MKSMTLSLNPGASPNLTPRWRDQKKLSAVRRALRALIPKPGDR